MFISRICSNRNRNRDCRRGGDRLLFLSEERAFDAVPTGDSQRKSGGTRDEEKGERRPGGREPVNEKLFDGKGEEVGAVGEVTISGGAVKRKLGVEREPEKEIGAEDGEYPVHSAETGHDEGESGEQGQPGRGWDAIAEEEEDAAGEEVGHQARERFEMIDEWKLEGARPQTIDTEAGKECGKNSKRAAQEAQKTEHGDENVAHQFESNGPKGGIGYALDGIERKNTLDGVAFAEHQRAMDKLQNVTLCEINGNVVGRQRTNDQRAEKQGRDEARIDTEGTAAGEVE
jgi:hypothetical protein